MLIKELFSLVLGKEIVDFHFRNNSIIVLENKKKSTMIISQYDTDGFKDSYDGCEINLDTICRLIVEWIFDTYRIYLSIELGEDSTEQKWWTCNFKYEQKPRSFYGEKNYKAATEAAIWVVAKSLERKYES